MEGLQKSQFRVPNLGISTPALGREAAAPRSRANVRFQRLNQPFVSRRVAHFIDLSQRNPWALPV